MLYEAVLDTQFAGQQCINRWNYVMTGTPASVSGSFALAYAMGFIPDGEPPLYDEDLLFHKLKLLQSPYVTYVELVVKAVYDVVDFYTLPFPPTTIGIGTNADSLSPAVAYGLRTNRVRQDIGRGFKRFVGVGAGDFTIGGELIEPAAARLQAVADAMNDAITYNDEGNTLTFSPVIVSKEKYTAPSGKDAYKYYATLQAQSAHLAAGVQWQIYEQLRTQGSRQYGRGS